MITADEYQEIKKCYNDPAYFVDNYVKIQHSSKGQCDFKLYEFQKNLLDSYVIHDRNIVASARQLGVTSLGCAFALWDAIFHPFKIVFLAADNERSSMFQAEKTRFMWNNLSDFITTGLKATTNSRRQLEFSNGSSIIFEYIREGTGKGYNVSTLICDNLAFVPNRTAIPFWVSITPSLATGTKVIFTSCYNQELNLFAEIWRESEKGLNNFKRHQLLFYDIFDKDDNNFEDFV